MKKIVTIIVCFFIVGILNAQYSTYADVISSGGGGASSGPDCQITGALCNFGVIGEAFVKQNMQGGNLSNDAGFIFLADPDICVSVEKPEPNLNDVRFYPNPVNDFLYIEIADNELEYITVGIYNMMGQSVWHKNYRFSSFESHLINLNLTHLVSGIYSVTISTNSQSISEKIIIEK